MRNKLLFALLLSFSASSVAETVSLEYKGFFDRMKVLKKGEYHLVDLAFTVPNTQECTVQSGSITTENKDYALSISPHQRLYLPFDEELKRDRALVNLNMLGSAQGCGIGMQVRAKLIHQQYNAKQVTALMDEMDDILDALQGFPLKYFRDPIDGVTFDFGQQTDIHVIVDGKKVVVKQRYQLNRDTLAKIGKIQFSAKPVSVSPLVL